MTISKTLFTWLLTIILGSVLSVFFIAIHERIVEGASSPDALSVFIIYLIIASFVFSIPAILIMKAFTDYILRSTITQKRKISYIHLTQVLCSIVTFTCIVVGFEVSDVDILLVISYLFIAYTSVGIALWHKSLQKAANQ